jgi:hypothetical protein
MLITGSNLSFISYLGDEVGYWGSTYITFNENLLLLLLVFMFFLVNPLAATLCYPM